MNREPGKRARAAGFSLLEVVVAFAILALALGGLYRIFSSAARQAILVGEYDHAVMLADSKLTEIGTANILTPGTEAGEFDEGYRWQRRVEAYNLEDESADRPSSLVPYRITVEVRWGQQQGQRSVALTTVRLRTGG